MLDLPTLLILLSKNYNLESYMLVIAKEMIVEARVSDFRELLDNLLNSKRFGFLDRLAESLELYKSKRRPTEDVKRDYARKLISKCRKLVKLTEAKIPQGYTLQKFANTATFNSFRNPKTNKTVFTDKEIQILEEIGGVSYWILNVDNYMLEVKMILAINRFNFKTEQKQIATHKKYKGIAH
jgi:hypothetical protein